MYRNRWRLEIKRPLFGSAKSGGVADWIWPRQRRAALVIAGIGCMGESADLNSTVRAVERAHLAERLAQSIAWAQRQKAIHEILWLDFDPKHDLKEPVPVGWSALLEALFVAFYEAPDADRCDWIRLVGLRVENSALQVDVQGASAMQFGMVRLASKLSARTCERCGAPASFDAIFKMPRCEQHGLCTSYL